MDKVFLQELTNKEPPQSLKSENFELKPILKEFQPKLS